MLTFVEAKFISNRIEVVEEEVSVEELNSSLQDEDVRGAAASPNIT